MLAKVTERARAAASVLESTAREVSMNFPTSKSARPLTLASILVAGILFSGVAGNAYWKNGRAVQSSAAAPAHPIVTPAELKWAPLIPGSQMAVVSGDPSASGPFVIRIKSAAGAEIPAHWHPTTENVTVLVGTFDVGMGDKLDPAKMTAMHPGDFVSMPATVHHFAKAETESIVQVHGMGPFAVNFVNPADAPRSQQ
jgi:quercetin dioxygenase-like cupin family protein